MPGCRGVLAAFAAALYDVIKLLGKESIVPRRAVRTVFQASPWMAMVLVLVIFLYIPIGSIPPILAGTEHDINPLPSGSICRDDGRRRFCQRFSLRQCRFSARDGFDDELRTSFGFSGVDSSMGGV